MPTRCRRRGPGEIGRHFVGQRPQAEMKMVVVCRVVVRPDLLVK
jgi:hypothetical protein